MAGELLDRPVAAFDSSPSPPDARLAAVGDLFQSARAELGLGPDDNLATFDRWLTLVGGPPGWFPANTFRPTTHLVQPPEDPVDGEELPDWFETLPDRPTVYVTFGTVFNTTPGIFELAFEAVQELDANVIVTVGEAFLGTGELGASKGKTVVRMLSFGSEG